MLNQTMSVRVSDDEIKEVAWRYIKDGDLELLTRKTLRDHITSAIAADSLQRGDDELKLLVKNLVPELLDRRERMEKDAEAQQAMRQGSQQSRESLSPEPKPSKNPVLRKAPSEKRIVIDAEGKDGESGGEDLLECDEAKRVKRRRVAESDGSGCSDAQTGGTLKRAKKKSAPASRGKVDKRLSKMLSVANRLGCRIPPRVLRCDEEDKIDACAEYLRSKGVKGQVLQMTSAAINEVRQRLDREKELDELDASNIIPSGSRRRRCTVEKSASRSAQGSKIKSKRLEDETEREADGSSSDAPADQANASSASSPSSESSQPSESSQSSESEFELSDDSS